jgi:hypothetical protein
MVLLGGSGFDGKFGQNHDSLGYAGMALYATDNDGVFDSLTLIFDNAGTLTRGAAFWKYPGDDNFHWFHISDMVVTCGTQPRSHYLVADKDQDCRVSFAEYAQARTDLLYGRGTFRDYSEARAALLQGEYDCNVER